MPRGWLALCWRVGCLLLTPTTTTTYLDPQSLRLGDKYSDSDKERDPDRAWQLPPPLQQTHEEELPRPESPLPAMTQAHPSSTTAPHPSGHSSGDDVAQRAAVNGYAVPKAPNSNSRPGKSLEDVSLEIRDKVEAFLAREAPTPLLKRVQSQVRDAIGVIQEALQRYGPDELALSYNGGKDCLVLLVLILACLPRRYSSSSDPSSTKHQQQNQQNQHQTFPTTLQAVYIVSQHPFAEVDDFVEASCGTYHLDLRRYTLPMRAALDAYLQDRPALRAIFVGTRRTDPHGERLTHFDPTDAGWPAFMRVHPVIDWHYVEIWAFIRHLDIPYCPLYDQGYTSLGGTKDTLPNPHLKADGEKAGFLPAYELVEDDEERLGRDR